ncbi:5693_t:CDS:2 [Diversispora eburnea]|uniref:RNA exonuclease 4 n=1 Tax=Diversispora eburnea TaxID=1213867 RepID=A0A9N8UUS8_9GLOM|nr:5693_t:CDS:2 [Diversispora eburnea]
MYSTVPSSNLANGQKLKNNIKDIKSIKDSNVNVPEKKRIKVKAPEKKRIKVKVPEKKMIKVKVPENKIDNKNINIGRLDCEMVGTGPKGKKSALARVSIVNYHGVVILDKYVRPLEYVTDFRTKYSGITPSLLVNSHDFKEVQTEVANIIKDRIVIGHALHNDFKALCLSHKHAMRRDTSLFKPFRELSKGHSPSLKLLAQEFLGKSIQDGPHNSIEDAQTCMMLYKSFKNQWEDMLFTKSHLPSKNQTADVNKKIVDVSKKIVDVNKKTVNVSKKIVDVNKKTINVSKKMVNVNKKIVNVNKKIVNVNKKIVNVNKKQLELEWSI